MSIKMTAESEEFGLSIPLSPAYLESIKKTITHLFPVRSNVACNQHEMKEYKDVKSEYNPLIKGYEYKDDVPEAVWSTIDYLRFNLGLEAKSLFTCSSYIGYFQRSCGTIIPSASNDTLTRVIINLNHGEVYHAIGNVDLSVKQKVPLFTRPAVSSNYVESNHALVVRKGFTDTLIVRRDTSFTLPRSPFSKESERAKIRPRNYLRYVIVIDFKATGESMTKLADMAEKPTTEMKKVALKAVGASSTLGQAGGSSGKALLKFKDLPTSKHSVNVSSDTTLTEGDKQNLDDAVEEAKLIASQT